MSRIALQGAADPAHFVTSRRNTTRASADIGGIAVSQHRGLNGGNLDAGSNGRGRHNAEIEPKTR
jgi:hypothetical protein